MKKVLTLMLLVISASAFSNEEHHFEQALEHFEAGRYHAALANLQQFEQRQSAGTTNHKLDVFRAQVFYQLGDYDQAIHSLTRGIKVAQNEQQVVEERWWQLLRYLYWEQGDYLHAIATIKSMDAQYPNPANKDWLKKLQQLSKQS